MLRSAIWSLLLALPVLAAAVPTPRHDRRAAASTLVIAQEFADPSIIQVGGTWYAFATTNGQVNIQLATSPDFVTWTVAAGYDALPQLGAWAQPGVGGVWAPDVVQISPSRYVLYYSAPVNGDSAFHCVGVATAPSVEGPYTPVDTVTACPLAQGGAIDADGFQDTDGTRYLVYKVDGNSLGLGGACKNDVAPQVPTPIVLQALAADGVTPVGAPVPLLDRDASDGPLIEAPSLARVADGTYVLFYSSGCYSDPTYATKYATAPAVAGPYTKYDAAPLLTTGMGSLVAPGGADVSLDGTRLAFHGDIDGLGVADRGMYVLQGLSIA